MEYYITQIEQKQYKNISYKQNSTSNNSMVYNTHIKKSYDNYHNSFLAMIEVQIKG